MAYWVLFCPRCKKDFRHSEVQMETTHVPDPFVGPFIKPTLPDAGGLLRCPHCRESSIFVTQQFRYSSA